MIPLIDLGPRTFDLLPVTLYFLLICPFLLGSYCCGFFFFVLCCSFMLMCFFVRWWYLHEAKRLLFYHAISKCPIPSPPTFASFSRGSLRSLFFYFTHTPMVEEANPVELCFVGFCPLIRRYDQTVPICTSLLHPYLNHISFIVLLSHFPHFWPILKEFRGTDKMSSQHDVIWSLLPFLPFTVIDAHSSRILDEQTSSKTPYCVPLEGLRLLKPGQLHLNELAS